jgi:hypothetical protein
VTRHLVSAAVLAAAQHKADEIMSANPGIKEMWMDEVCTSAVSDRNGLALLETDFDWIVAFLTWRAGGQIAREKR